MRYPTDFTPEFRILENMAPRRPKPSPVSRGTSIQEGVYAAVSIWDLHKGLPGSAPLVPLGISYTFFSPEFRSRYLSPGDPCSAEEHVFIPEGLASWRGMQTGLDNLAQGLPFHDIYTCPLPQQDILESVDTSLWYIGNGVAL